VGSQQAGERAAVRPSLIESEKINGHDPWACLKDVFERLPAPKNRNLELLLPLSWRPANNAAAPVAPAVITPGSATASRFLDFDAGQLTYRLALHQVLDETSHITVILQAKNDRIDFSCSMKCHITVIFQGKNN
jgi:IS66 C-terminal element